MLPFFHYQVIQRLEVAWVAVIPPMIRIGTNAFRKAFVPTTDMNACHNFRQISNLFPIIIGTDQQSLQKKRGMDDNPK
jgi:hypothetical protein